MKKILFLGYNKKNTKLIDEIKFFNKKILINQTNQKVNLTTLRNYNTIISFGYRHLIDSNTIKKYRNPIINLHIGYLPYNKGAHPNFWSFVENTPAGISIHEINSGIDTGNLIYQKLIDFELYKNRKILTFEKTYKILINEIENLFLNNINNLINNDFDTYQQIGKGTYHNRKDLPKLLKSWKQNIYSTVLKYNSLTKSELLEKLDILDEIESTRRSNNINWMNIVRNSLIKSPKNTLTILKRINFDDNKISELFKKIVK